MTRTQVRPQGNVMERALAAYRRTAGPYPLLSVAASGVEEYGGFQYAVLRDSDEVLAVYRIVARGELRLLRRWPTGLHVM
jgi:hypothetical protein